MNHPKLDVIAVGAHPDDVEIACGGTLASMVKQGYRVGIIDLTNGEPTPNSPGPEVRLQEANDAANALGIEHRIILDLPNRRLFDDFDSRVRLATEFRKYRPDIVIGFGDKTPLASPDHWQAVQITDAAVFYSRLTKWDEHFEQLPVHTIKHQLYFQLAFEPSHSRSNANQVTVDISDALTAKMDSIRCYKSQFDHKPYILERIESVATTVGMTAGFAAAESFTLTRPLGTKDLVQSLTGGKSN